MRQVRNRMKMVQSAARCSRDAQRFVSFNTTHEHMPGSTHACKMKMHLLINVLEKRVQCFQSSEVCTPKEEGFILKEGVLCFGVF